MVGRAELAEAQEPQKSPNARGPKAQGHWVTSEARGPEPTGSDITGHELEGMSERAWVRQPMPSFAM